MNTFFFQIVISQVFCRFPFVASKQKTIRDSWGLVPKYLLSTSF